MLRGIIFDLDGVIVFTDRLHYRAWKQLADELGIYFDEQINDRLRGVSRMASLDIVLERYAGPTLTDEDKLHLAEQKNDTYRGLLGTMKPEDVPGDVRAALTELRRRGYLLAIGSSSKNAGYILERTALTDAFDAVSDGNGISHSKPDPEVFLNAAALLGLSPGECAVIEDAEAGIAAAKAGGMTAVAVGAAKDSERADFAADGFGELLRLFPEP